MTEVTRNDIREKVVQYCETRRAAWSEWDLTVEYPNIKLVDFNTQSKPFVSISIMYDGGNGIGMGYGSIHRVLGNLIIESYAKRGTGVIKMNDLIDHFYRGISDTDALYPMRTFAAGFTPQREADDWLAVSAVIPFWYDSE